MSESQKIFTKDLICCIIASVVTAALAQYMIGVKVLSMGAVNFCIGTMLAAAPILLLYGISRRITLSIILSSAFFMVISTINVYVYNFRNRLFEPLDLFSAKTALEVVSNYSLFPVPGNIAASWAIWAALMAVLLLVQRRYKTDISKIKRLPAVISCILLLSVSIPYVNNLETCHWYRDGVLINGYILDFASKFKEITAAKPAGYSAQAIEELSKKYSAGPAPDEISEEDLPHIIVIMDEAFSDIGILGDFTTNQPVTPFISGLKDNTISGYALVSIFGGNTSDTEYEFLTGNSLAWLAPNVVPYQQYIKTETYSMVSYLKDFYNYKCIAMHPYLAGAWNRPAAYKYLGFDESYFIDSFPCKDFIRKFVSDREMFDFLINTYEANKSTPLFLFGVSMQNHGGYDYEGENYAKSISIEDAPGAYPDAEQYLTLIRETDIAVENLVSYFEDKEEKVIIAFFGDHQPKLSDSFYEAIRGSAGNSESNLDFRQEYYKVPFFIWANYDIEESEIGCTSISYLSSYVYETAGISLPPYNKFLKDMEAAIPSINANGFYSRENGCYQPFEKAGSSEKTWLNQYEMLQYNNLFDKRNINQTLFPLQKLDN